MRLGVTRRGRASAKRRSTGCALRARLEGPRASSRRDAGVPRASRRLEPAADGRKSATEEPEGVRSALLDSTRTFTKPMSLAYSRKHCLQMFRLYLRMIPHWFPHTRLLKRRGGGGSGSQSGSRVNRPKRRNPRNWRGLPRLARRVRAPGRARRRAVVSCMPRMLRLSVDRVARPSRVAPGTSSREAARSTRSRNKHAARRRAGSRGRRPDATRTSDAGPCR